MTVPSISRALRDAFPVLACIAIVGMALGLLTPLLSVRMQQAGASNSAIGLLAAVTAIATMFTGPMVPKLSRMIGGRRLLLAGIAIALVMMPSFHLIDDWHFWYPLRFFLSFALTTLFVLTEIWINAVTPNEIRGRVLGVYVSVLSAGFMCGPLILTAVGPDGPAPFLIGMGLIALASLPVIFAKGDLSPMEESGAQGMLSLVAQSPATFSAAFAYGAIEVGFFGLMPVHALSHGLSVPTMGLLLSAMAAGQVVLQIPIGFLADFLDRRFVLLLCGLVGILGMVVLAIFPTSPLILVPTFFIWGGIVVGFYTIGLTILGERYSGAALVSVNAAFASLYGVGALIGPSVTGVTMDRWPDFGLPLILGAICVLVLIPITFRWLQAPHLFRDAT
jgi:MFS family permease